MRQRILFLRQEPLESLISHDGSPDARIWFPAKSLNQSKQRLVRQDVLERPLNSIYLFADYSDGLLVA